MAAPARVMGDLPQEQGATGGPQQEMAMRQASHHQQLANMGGLLHLRATAAHLLMAMAALGGLHSQVLTASCTRASVGLGILSVQPIFK